MSISKLGDPQRAREDNPVTVEERFERIENNLDMLIKIHLDNDREYRGRFDQIMRAIEELRASTKELKASTEELRTASKQDGEHIRALVRIAEIHERRISDLEGDNGQA
jgi:sulfatase maturation enzyme AslB (radical SAM superfamily)